MLARTTTVTPVVAPLTEVMGYQNAEVVARFANKLGLDEAGAAQLFEDTKRYLYLSGINVQGNPRLAPPAKVDKGWHEFILYTEDYAAFCKKYLGRFIHHHPRRTTDASDGGSTLRFTIGLATATFGELSANWEVPSKDRSDCTTNCCSEGDPCHGDDPVA